MSTWADMAGLLKRAAKRWVRPLVIPVARLFTRYSPFDASKRLIWRLLVGPFLQNADQSFVATTIFGAAIAGNTQDFIQRRIYYFGVWEPNLTAFLKTRLHEGDVFVDVGANIGYFTLLASQLVGQSGKVIAIEASPDIYARLLANLKRNRATNVQTMNVAAGDREGTTRVFLASSFNIGESTTFQTREGSRYEGDVATRQLDSLVPPRDLSKVRMVKIDVEGAEGMVVEGMRLVLSQARTDVEVAVEIRPEALRSRGMAVKDFFSLFAGFGFHPYRIDNNYEIASYVSWKKIQRPVRIVSPIARQVDVIFSRVDADFL